MTPPLKTFHASLMAEAIRQNGGEPIPFIWFWPENASSALVMTHDVETARGLESVAELMELDMSHAIRASYQLIPEARYQIPAHLIAQIRAAGNEVNVHDLRHDGRLYSDIANFPGKAEKVNRHVEDFGAQGFRAACMYRRPEWYSNFKFSYDTPSLTLHFGSRNQADVAPFFHTSSAIYSNYHSQLPRITPSLASSTKRVFRCGGPKRVWSLPVMAWSAFSSIQTTSSAKLKDAGPHNGFA
jgi:hypothetical protein